MKLRSIHLIYTTVFLALNVVSIPVSNNEIDTNDAVTSFQEGKTIVLKSKCKLSGNSKGSFKNDTKEEIKETKEKQYFISTEDIENYYRIDWSTYTVDKINSLTDQIIEDETKIIKEIESIPDEKCSFESVIFKMVREIEDEKDFLISSLSFLQKVSPNAEIRDASSESSYKIESFQNENIAGNSVLNQKIAKAIENIANGLFAEPENLEDKRLLDSIRNEVRLSNHSLEDTRRYSKLKNQIYEDANAFMDCIYDDNTSTHIFTKEELEGVPEVVLNMMETVECEDGSEAYNVNIDGIYYSTIVKYAIKEETRKTAMTIYNQRCKPNIELLKNIVNMELQASKINGYSSHSEEVLKSKMAKNTETVYKFLDSLKEKILPVVKKDIQKLLDIKKEERAKVNEPFDNTLHLYDVEYYKRIAAQNEGSVDVNKISEYFPLIEVTDEMVKIYEELLSLKITEVDNPIVWYKDVRQFIVFDKKTNKYLGTFYLDLSRRSGKVSYDGSFHIGYGFEKEDGTRGAYPVAALVTNFSAPTESRPALLSHDDVTGLFHELGHIFHEIISETKYTRYNGYNVEQDFLEVPSQFLEYWCWEEEIIERISHYYKDPSQRMPKELIEQIIKSKNNYSGMYYSTLLFKSYVDMNLYSIKEVDENLDPVKIWNDARKEVTLLESVEDTWPIVSFDHIIDGYDAGYYGYLWSQVYAADMFYSQFKKYGIFNREIGDKYRNVILKRGSTRDAMDMLKEFLGREPNDDAFIQSLSL